jgi:hypothetical protein
MRKLKRKDLLIAKKTACMSGTKEEWITKNKIYKIVNPNTVRGVMFKSNVSDEHYCPNWWEYFNIFHTAPNNIKLL